MARIPAVLRHAVPPVVRHAVQALRVSMRGRRLDVLSRLKVRVLSGYNSKSSRPVTGGAPVCVSLTTYGKRLETVYLTIESIAAGSERPARLILWLDDDSSFRAPPAALRRLVRRGLEIKLTDNLGPHTKYHPYVSGEDDGVLALVTADDDIIYPRTWLAGLMAAHREHPEDVICYRAWVLRANGGALAPYDDWGPCLSTEPDVRNFATGVSGVLYPPPMIREIAAAGVSFKDTCPSADDIWLHAVAIRAGRRVRQLTSRPQHFPLIPNSQDVGLVHSNFVGKRNDVQAAATYRTADIKLLSAGR